MTDFQVTSSGPRAASHAAGRHGRRVPLRHHARRAVSAVALIGDLATVLALAITLLTACSHSSAPAPASCRTPIGSFLPSGDAGIFWVAQVHRLETFVCTDGTWVHVTGYGNG